MYDKANNPEAAVTGNLKLIKELGESQVVQIRIPVSPQHLDYKL